jgi:serine/threonine-protein kinase PknG
VLREVVATLRPKDGVALHSAPSVLFEAPLVSDDTLDWQQLPALRIDPHDPMAAWLASVSVADPAARLDVLATAPQQTVEVQLALARTALEADRPELAAGALAKILADDPWEWRAVWVQGLAGLAGGDVPVARAAFNAVYGQVPGELAPKLGLALACERSGEADVAERFYGVCARTDANYIAPAAFGLTRIRTARGDLDGALAGLDLVPATSRAYVEARRQRAGMLAASGRGLASLSEALGSIESVTIDPHDRATLTAGVLDAALTTVLDHGPDPAVQIAGRPAQERSLRDGLESAYRQLASLTEDRHERVRLVDAANRARRWTLR